MNKVSFMVAKNGDVSIYMKGFSTTVPSSHPNIEKIKRFLNFCRENDVNVDKAAEKIKDLMDFFGRATKKVGGLTVTDTHVLFNGKPLNGVIVDKILEFQSKNYNFDALIKFLNKVMENPSEESRQSLFDWVESSGLIIDDDGDVLGYKSVRYDFMDHYTGTFDNSVGKVVEMNRDKCDPNRDVSCSRGLHVGSLEYARGFGTDDRRLIVVKVNPKDVVSVPSSENCVKMRVCKYKVIDELAEYRVAPRLEQSNWVASGPKETEYDDDFYDLLENEEDDLDLDEENDWDDDDDFFEDWDDEENY